MWSQLVLSLLVGLAFGSNSPAWRENTEYSYKIRIRNLVGFDGHTNDFTGIVMKTDLVIRAHSNEVLVAKLKDAQYAQVHAQLPDGWETFIPDSQLQYRPLPISKEAFQIILHKTAIKNVIVSEDISNWEANMIKAFVSQFQLDTTGVNLIDSTMNIHPKEGDNNAVFKTMEDTVTGISETLYEIHPLPEIDLQSKPWLVPRVELKGDGEFIEIVKSKNYSRSEQRPVYHYGYLNMDQDFFPASNKMGEFFTRTSISRAVVTGTLPRYIIQSSYTKDIINIGLTEVDDQSGSIRSSLNVTLAEVKPCSDKLEEISNPISLGSLVYKFNNPFDKSNKVRAGKPYQRQVQSSGELAETSHEYLSEEDWEQEEPELNEAPASPLLPFTVGYNGHSIKNKNNIVEIVCKLTQKIGQDLQDVNKLPEMNTVGTFITLCSIVRVMDEKEIQSGASQLYTKEHEGIKSAAWRAYRDAVAQAGTGPSLLSIQEWIKSGKIQDDEVVNVVETQARNTRQPTEQYMRAFYEMVTSPEIMHRQRLNETALLSYTKLVNRVYVDKTMSHNNFPVHAFGTFRTKAGYEFLVKVIIPDLTQKLHQAIGRADTQQIHVYIRALGNVGHPYILRAFEPYLEGVKQASQFQRLLMVLSFDKLVKSDPMMARSVLFAIYQNPNEDDQVRVAAVYQLMRTSPPPDLLQRIAVYTNIDTSEHVNSAVKSAIESASRLEGEEFAVLRKSAQAAKKLLNKNIQYGIQFSKNILRSYVADELKLSYKQNMVTFGSEDAFIPDGLRYSLRSRLAGVREQIFTAHALVSSIDDLFSVVGQQTEEYEQQQEKKQQQQGQKGQWSSEKIAELLGMTVDNDDQLEGMISIDTSLVQKMFSFDNRTIERLPEVLRELEDELKVGKEFRYTRMVIDEEKALAFATGSGLPSFLFSDKPSYTQVEANLKGEANPKLCTGKSLAKPDQIEAEIDLHGVFYGKSQAQLGFITPFDHQKYSAGYDKNFKLQVPVRNKVEIDLKQMQLKSELQFWNPEKNSRMIHFSTWPYIYKGDILDWQSEQKQIIRKVNAQKLETVIGRDIIGLPLKVQLISDEHLNIPELYKKLQRHDAISAMLASWVDERIQHTEINVDVDPNECVDYKMIVRLGAQHKYYPGREAENFESQQNVEIDQLDKLSEDPTQRQREYLEKAAAGIPSSKAYAVDAIVQFKGQQPIVYELSAAVGKSNVNPKSRLIAHIKRTIGQEKPYHIALLAKSHIPNTNGLDMEYAMKFDPTATTQIQFVAGEDLEDSTKVEAQIHLRKSEQRQLYLEQEPMYHECQRQMQQGNHQLPACANMTIRANFYDKLDVKVQYKNAGPEITNATYKVYSVLRHIFYPNTDENIIDAGTGKDEIEFQARINPELNYANLSITTKRAHVRISSIPVEQWAKDLFVSHPVFHLKSRLIGRSLGYDIFRPICVVDKTATNTFDNKTYTSNLGNEWTVMLQYVPRIAANAEQQQQGQDQPAKNQLKRQIENYVVLVRACQGSASQKEVKIIAQTPRTQQQLIEITMKFNQGLPKVDLNGQEIEYNVEQITDLANGGVQIYALPNNEVKVELPGSFYVIFDGSRVKLTITDGKFRSSVRGLCGTLTGDETTDFQSPQQCILSDPTEFIASYTIFGNGQQQNQHIADLKSKTQRDECYRKEVLYVNVISESDAGSLLGSPNHGESTSMCTKHQTRYERENDEICFTLRPIPVCKNECKQMGTILKNISVHCVKKTNVSLLWKGQIDKGASPDFSHKSETKRIKMKIPQRCSP